LLVSRLGTDHERCGSSLCFPLIFAAGSGAPCWSRLKPGFSASPANCLYRRSQERSPRTRLLSIQFLNVADSFGIFIALWHGYNCAMKRPRLLRSSRVLIAALLLSAASSGNAQAPNSAHAKRRVLYAPPPQYPLVARARHWTGAGLFACNLRPDGTVVSVDVVRSTGHDVLDDAATSALRRWKFPSGGSHVIRIPLSFTIGGVRHRMSGAVISD